MPDTGWKFFTSICCKICTVCLKRLKIPKLKRGWRWPILKKFRRCSRNLKPLSLKLSAAFRKAKGRWREKRFYAEAAQYHLAQKSFSFDVIFMFAPLVLIIEASLYRSINNFPHLLIKTSTSAHLNIKAESCLSLVFVFGHSWAETNSE